MSNLNIIKTVDTNFSQVMARLKVLAKQREGREKGGWGYGRKTMEKWDQKNREENVFRSKVNCIQSVNKDKHTRKEVTPFSIIFFFFGDRVLLCLPGWSPVARSWLTATSTSWV